MKRNDNIRNLTQELIGKLVTIELKHDTVLHNVKVLDADALLIKVLFKSEDTIRIIYIPITSIKYVEILNKEGHYESSESKFI